MENTEEIIIVKRVTSNAWLKDINSINKDKIHGSFKGADGSMSKTRIGLGIDKNTGLRKNVFSGKEDLRISLEKQLGFTEGTLSPSSSYWSEFSVDIEGSELVLRPQTIPMDELRLQVLKSKSFVAHSLEDLKGKANADFVIVSQTEEAKKDNKLRDVRKKAYAAFATMTATDMSDVLVAMGKKPTSMSKEMIEDALGRIVDTEPAKFLIVFTNPKFNHLVYINKLLNVNILSKKGEAIIYEEEVLGYDITSAVDYLNNPSNKTILAAINAAYESLNKNKK